MNIWFIRCNGETAHNQPGTSRFVPGEPPRWPSREFNYHDKCLEDGFARYGLPAAGDLREPRWRTRVRSAYGSLFQPHQGRYLEQFAAINSGDLILLPAYTRRYDVHLGIVVPPRQPARAGRWRTAYYYHYDIQNREWFDCAHRVDVDWARLPDGRPMVHDIPEIGGTWLRAFGEVKAAREHVLRLAKAYDLIR